MRKYIALGGIAVAMLAAVLLVSKPSAEEGASSAAVPTSTVTARAIFGGGCFWCVEEAFDNVEGVVTTTSGYSGGTEVNPTYEQVSSHETGHAEVVEVVYDPAKISFEKLLYVFWRNVDPVTKDRQFCDGGAQYRSAIFVTTDEQLRLAQESKAELEKSGRFKEPIVTEIIPAGAFYPAEEYHQDYHNKNPIRYKFYKTGCGRQSRLEELWGSEAGGGQPPS
jgi:peptide-methionine (S)-S-oxide reductase